MDFLEGILVDSTQNIEGLPLLSEAELHQQLVEWNDTQMDYPLSQCFHELFEAQVERTPEAVAVAFEQEQLSYRELNQRANQMAHYLQDMGVGPDTLVSLLAERGISFLIAILAVFKAGGAYLPLDPHHPSERLQRILEHSGARLILAAKEFAATLSRTLMDMQAETPPRVIYLEDLQFQPGHAIENLPACATPRNLSYVIYTSGSTGMPKGAMIEHRGMINHIYAKITALNLTATDSVAQTASQCFDISVWQFLAALLVGGRVHIFNDDVSHDPMRLLTRVAEHQITILETVPSLLRVMLELVESKSIVRPNLEDLRWLVPTGEALPPEFCRRWLNTYPHTPLLNAYGPTECSDDVTHFPIYQPLADTLVHTPIGRPINNIQIYILDRKLRPLPVGAEGELYVGGVGVGRGYLNDPQRTTEAFIANPFSDEPGARLYKTGDLARYLSDGNIEFLGRIDYQVKIRGNRIELGEIEAMLRKHPDVQDVVVLAREDTPGDKYLAAYVVVPAGVTGSDLRNYLMEKLPDYMVPTAFMVLETFPLTPNGKVDRRALPAPERIRSRMEETFVAPTSPMQEQLIQIWEELLDVEPIGIRDNFFESGGHSLLAVRLVDRIAQVCGKKISGSTLLANATIEQLAVVLESEEINEENPPEVVQTGNSRPSFFPGRRPLLSTLKKALSRPRTSRLVKNSASDSGSAAS